MPDYECPQCAGGFPEPKPTNSGPECPWCGEPVNGKYGKTIIGFDGRERLKESLDRNTGPEYRGSVPKPPDLSGTILPTDRGSLSVRNDGTTPCPECGDDMPMGTWAGPKPKCRKCRRNEGPSLGSGIQQRMANSSQSRTVSTTGNDIDWGEEK